MAQEVIEVIPYFSDWRVSNRVAWPNGKGRLYQPVKLAQAFDVLDEYVTEVLNEQ